ncbi:GNAT family N-acetyltransferase [Zhihengliuella salsuginis]|uniref:N-acetyltransferase domain-containing protein n=1 Tax=Zhihengliuella salsuginis TaxID=578222 RepID=A0ABQ3GP29_9MICC|nr:hypothetical protein [Zhihengliuella salsuginis]GHD13469.1 hypothetical protein GCM10008096_29700 [Zhihengliuella salsuginis]
MELESGTRAIVALVWARRLGLPDDALQQAAMGAPSERLAVPVDDGSVLFLRYLTGSVLCAPAWALEVLAAYDDDALAADSGLVRALRGSGHDGAGGLRGAGDYALYYLDEPVEVQPSDTAAVSFERGHAQALEDSSPKDDTIGLNLAGRDHPFTLVADEEQVPLATASYDIWEGLVADVATVTLPQIRRHGLGAYITAVAADDALTQGYTPQWRAPQDSQAAHQLALDVGFLEVGSVSTAVLG